MNTSFSKKKNSLSEISDFLGEYPSIKDDKLQYKIAQRKEFYDLKLDRYENEPSVDSNFKHQVIIERFLSNNTDYNKLLLNHDLGTGKTRTSILVSEINKKIGAVEGGAQLSTVYKALVLVKNKLLINNFKHELTKVSDLYVPKDDKGQPIDPKKESIKYQNNLTRLTEKYYEFETFQRMTSRIIQKSSDSQIKKLYSNRIIIIDEAHNLRIQSGRDEKDTKTQYKNMHRFLHIVENCKILLLTGTPIWDRTDEIASLMNLILPLDNQMDYENFNDTYFKDDELINRKKLAKYFYGRVSYLRQLQSDVIKDYQGTAKPWMKHTKIYLDEMSKHQYESINRAKSDILEGKKTGRKIKGGVFRQFELEASNFTFPDGTYGAKGVKKHISKIRKVWKFNDRIMANQIKDNLKEYSSKFYSIIQQILNNPKELTFVYHHIVMNGGAILFGMILQLFGFERTMGPGVFGREKKRYAIVTSATTSATDAKRIIDAFNDPRNKHGDYIQVLIGSRKMAEGITLKNVQQMHIATPFWHMPSMDQAIGRTIRFGAHEELKKGILKGDTRGASGPFGTPEKSVSSGNIHVRVYLHASSYKTKHMIDIEVYQIAEKKDYYNHQIYRVLKQASIDCPLNYKRNVNPLDKSHSRDCDYEECNYECMQMKPSSKGSASRSVSEGNVYEYNIPSNKIIKETYNLYYSQKDIQYILSYLKYLFKFYHKLNLGIIASYIDKSKILILRSLEYIINHKIVINERYGFPSFLKEYNNIYFLDINISESQFDYRNTYYLDNPIIREKIDMTDILDIMRIKNEDDRIKYFCKLPSDNKDDITEQLDEMDYKVRIFVIESAYDILQEDPTNKKAKIIMNHLDLIYTIKNIDVANREFEKFRESLKRDRNIYVNFEKFKQLILSLSEVKPSKETIILSQQKLFDKLEIYLRQKKDKKISRKEISDAIKKVLEKLEKKSLDNIKESKTAVHVLFNSEPVGTSYKRSLKPSGLMRCYDYTLEKSDPSGTLKKSVSKGDISTKGTFEKSIYEWIFCPRIREEEYLHQIKELEDMTKKRGLEDNPYGVYGTIDSSQKDMFRIVEGTGKGFICTSISNKPKLARLILELRRKDIELEIQTTLKPDISKTIVRLNKNQLILAIQGNYHSGMDIFKQNLEKMSEDELRVLDTLMTVDVKKVLCPMIKEWFSNKGLLFEI